MYVYNTLDVCILCVCVCVRESESERERLGDLNFSCFSCTIILLCCCSTHPRPTDYGIYVHTCSCISTVIIAAIHVHMYSYIGAYPGAVGLHIDSM